MHPQQWHHLPNAPPPFQPPCDPLALFLTGEGSDTDDLPTPPMSTDPLANWSLPGPPPHRPIWTPGAPLAKLGEVQVPNCFTHVQ